MEDDSSILDEPNEDLCRAIEAAVERIQRERDTELLKSCGLILLAMLACAVGIILGAG